ncbi:MAG: hypothetical protein CML41_00765 [Rhodobacteraceae bacterium]|jgi:hypothetical protein|uniref:Uncharacterized protein n=1 Tax=viral metagenome TaxID=1070528 RepID=A0A6C0CMZ0_9ZZZZ|nr:hypothetical protein [Paracoccaceae bacterium]
MESTISKRGPLVVEYNGRLFIEHCYIITEKNIENMLEKIKDIPYTRVEQTTETSFELKI